MGISREGIKFTEIVKPDKTGLRLYDDPAVPGQRIVQRWFADQQGPSQLIETQWEAFSAADGTFSSKSEGPWKVTLVDFGTVRKDAYGKVTCNASEPVRLLKGGIKYYQDANVTHFWAPNGIRYVQYKSDGTLLRIDKAGVHTRLSSM